LLHAYSRTTAAMRAQTKISYCLFNKLHNSILGYKLRTFEAENP